MFLQECVIENINYITKQFLCNVPLLHFKWNNIYDHLQYNEQQILINHTVHSELVLKRPINPNYQKVFLKRVIEHLEKKGSVIHDDVYSAYGKLVALHVSKTEYFKHYKIGCSGNIISLIENCNLISNGTTGLRTWQASLALAEWAILNADLLANKTILELGSGLGLAGLVVAKECNPKTVFLTDCHPTVLKTLSDNVKLNIENKDNDLQLEICDRKSIGDFEKCIYGHSGVPNIYVLDMPWEEFNEELCGKLGKVDRVVAADVVYDTDLFEGLIHALNCLSSFCMVEEFIFSCTERNPKTLELFIEKLEAASFALKQLPVPNQNNFLWPTDTPIRIISFCKT